MMRKKPAAADESAACGWYYLRNGAPEQGQVGPLAWEELQGLAASGVLWPIDLVLHPVLPQWAEAGQVPGLFPRVARSGQNMRGASPRRACAAAAHIRREQPGDHPAYQPAWTAPAPRLRPRALPVLLPLLVSAILGGVLAACLTLWSD